MIAMIVGDEFLRRGPIPWALERAGFHPRETFTTDEAHFDLENHGHEGCVLVVDAHFLGTRAGSRTWATFLNRMPDLPAVVVELGSGKGPGATRALEPGRVVVLNPFDPAAVVSAVQRAVAGARSIDAPLEPQRAEPRRVRRPRSDEARNAS